MRFYKWQILAYQHGHENHVFNNQFGSDDHFISLCGTRVGGFSGEDKNKYYCPVCKERAPLAEAKAQTKEDARIAKLERKRPSALVEISCILTAMQIDDLLSLLISLKQK